LYRVYFAAALCANKRSSGNAAAPAATIVV
jgi:hypothetical protein